MDILYLLIPFSAVLVFAILGVFAWAVHDGQFDDLSRHAAIALEGEPGLEESQRPPVPGREES